MREITPQDMFRLTGLKGTDWRDAGLLQRAEELLVEDTLNGVPMARTALIAVQVARQELLTPTR